MQTYDTEDVYIYTFHISPVLYISPTQHLRCHLCDQSITFVQYFVSLQKKAAVSSDLYFIETCAYRSLLKTF